MYELFYSQLLYCNYINIVQILFLTDFRRYILFI